MSDSLTTFVCQLPSNLRASNSWNPQDISRTLQGLIYSLLNGVEVPDIFVYLLIYAIIYSVNSLVKVYGRPHVLTPGASFAQQLLYPSKIAYR